MFRKSHVAWGNLEALEAALPLLGVPQLVLTLAVVASGPGLVWLPQGD